MAGQVIGTAVITITGDTTQFETDVQRSTEKAGKKSGLGMGAAIGTALKAGAKVTGGAVAGILSVSLAKGFSRLKAIDDAQGKLKGLGYTAKQITEIMNNALASVKGTAFGLGDAASQAAVLVAAGIKPGKELTKTLKLLADTATIAGVPMNEIGSIFGKVAANGKVTLEAIGQLQDRGVPALAFLAKATGKSMGQVSEAVSAGKIDFNTFQKAMEVGLGGAALSSGKTFTGALANVGAALSRFGAGLLSGVFPQMAGLFSGIIPKIDALVPKAKELGAAFGAKFAAGVKQVQLLAKGFSDGTGPGGALRDVVGGLWTVLSGLFTVGMQVVSYLADHNTQAKILVGTTAALLAVTQAHAAVLAVQAAGGIAKYITSIKIVATATKVWAAVQWVLNAALAANPITLIIIGLVALGAALFIAWKKSETFRSVVLAVWSAIKAAVDVVVKWITGTAVPWLVGAWDAIVAGAKALWDSIIAVWNGVLGVLRAVGDWIAKVFGPTFRTLLAIVEFVFKAIDILIRVWWKVTVRPIFDLVRASLKLLGDAFSWLWKNAVKPAIDFISAAVVFFWRSTVKPTFDLVKAGVQSLGDKFSWLWKNAIKPAWDGLTSVIKTGWDKVMTPVFDAIKKGVDLVKVGFDKSVQGIKVAWDKLEGYAKAPVKFVIQTVLNKGLVRAFNWLGGKVGGPHIDDIPLPFASGGVLPGYTPGRDVHQFWSPTAGRLALSGGEAIMRPEFTKAVGGAAGVARLNARARAGQKFALGGVFGDVWDALSDPKKFLMSHLPSIPGSGAMVDLGKASVKHLVKAAADKITGLFDSGGGSAPGAGSGVQRWAPVVLRALGLVGQPSSMLGITLRRMNQESGGNPTIVNRWDSNWLAGHPSVGLMQVIRGTFQAYAGQMRNVGPFSYGVSTNPLANIYSSMRYALDRYGSLPAAYGRPGGYAKGGVFSPAVFDNGGVLGPGLNVVRNATGRPEHLLPAGSFGDVYLMISMEELSQLRTIEDFVKMLETKRVQARKTARSGAVSA